MGDIIKNIKEFIWDVVGYLIPGFLLILVFNLVFSPSVGIKNEFLIEWTQFNDYLIIVLSYILGYVVYSLTILKVRTQDKILNNLIRRFPKHKNTILNYKSDGWEEKFKNSATFHNAVSFLKENGYKKADEMKINEIRNILMSRNPSMDQKVYTFMFRSSLFDHISTILLIVLFLVIIQFIFSFWNIYFLKTTPQFKIIYVVFLLLIPQLGRCKRIFFPIAKRIPFSNTK
ncbi:hypothetical protein [Aquimarina celericrescens]|uniref:Uncharacterized protein n=1 Tax=Aquimarina celericrescens TaxID=1964542 RepID=A0ABW5AX50_9FLAO|nr:hypothetical protein [Aquimarina celericrescens]